jgi:hypothetical protein
MLQNLNASKQLREVEDSSVATEMRKDSQILLLEVHQKIHLMKNVKNMTRTESSQERDTNL